MRGDGVSRVGDDRSSEMGSDGGWLRNKIKHEEGQTWEIMEVVMGKDGST